METKTVILTKGSREIDIHEIDDVVVNHEPTTYDTKKDIFSCRYCKRMYQSPIWLEQHEAECDLRADSKFKKIMVKQSSSVNPTENRADDPGNTNPSPEYESNHSPENESNFEQEPPSPGFYMPAHNHIDAYDTAYQTNHPSNADHCNHEHQIYPHEDYENNPTDPNNDSNEIVLEPMDSQPAETAEIPTPSPIQAPPSSSDNHSTSTPNHNIETNNDRGQEEDQDFDVPKLEPITGATNELKDDEDSIVIYQDHQDSQETISDNEEDMSLNGEQNCTNEAIPSNISDDEETDSEDDSEYETFSG